MIEMRWVLTREQVAGTFSEPLDWPDGTMVFARLQFRELLMVESAATWREIPVVSEIGEAPRLSLVTAGPSSRRGH